MEINARRSPPVWFSSNAMVCCRPRNCPQMRGKPLLWMWQRAESTAIGLLHVCASYSSEEAIGGTAKQKEWPLTSPLYLARPRLTRPLPRGVAGHVAHPVRSIVSRQLPLRSTAISRHNRPCRSSRLLHSLAPRLFAVNRDRLLQRRDRKNLRLTQPPLQRARLPAFVLRHLRSAPIARGLLAERYRSYADTRPSARSDRSNELRQTLPGRGAWSAGHSSK
jgi:hypothetical protein